jgi:hypothetical protein
MAYDFLIAVQGDSSDGLEVNYPTVIDLADCQKGFE